MAKHQHLMMATALSIVLLGGCEYPQIAGSSGNSGGNQNPAPAAQPDPIQEAGQQADQELEAAKISFGSIPEQIILSPGAKQSLPHAELVTFVSSAPDIISVDSTGTLTVNANAQNGQQATITVTFGEQKRQTLIKVKASLESTIKTVNGVPTVANPLDRMVVVNKQRSLPNGFVPKNLVEPQVPFSFKGKSEKRLMRAEAAKALEAMFAQAKKENITLLGVSGYRSAPTQNILFENNVKTQGIKLASRYSAQSGKSEHQTGLAIDVSGTDSRTRLEESFADTAEGKWLAANSAQYGFIIRYPKGKEAVTGYAYEPWHIRYVGVQAAKEITSREITLEEYFHDALPVHVKK